MFLPSERGPISLNVRQCQTVQASPYVIMHDVDFRLAKLTRMYRLLRLDRSIQCSCMVAFAVKLCFFPKLISAPGTSLSQRIPHLGALDNVLRNVDCASCWPPMRLIMLSSSMSAGLDKIRRRTSVQNVKA